MIMTPQQHSLSPKNHNDKPTGPGHVWYKNYMVLIFVIGLPLLVVLSCIYLVVYSVKIQDSVVRDDWYMDGKTLYQDVSRDTLLYKLGINAEMTIHTDGKIDYYLNYPKDSLNTGVFHDGTPLTYPTTLELSLSHATDMKKDRNTTLTHQNDKHYVGAVNLDSLSAKYYVQVSHDKAPNWRMRQIARLPVETTTTIKFEPLPSVIPHDNSN